MPLWPVGPVGKPTELHVLFPLMAMTYTKYPQACKALMAFMLEADQFNKWTDGVEGLSHAVPQRLRQPTRCGPPIPKATTVPRSRRSAR